jgi:hypothetical protein
MEPPPDWSDTDRFLALHFPGIRKSWLKRISDKVVALRRDKKDADMHVRWRRGRDQWTGWDR